MGNFPFSSEGFHGSVSRFSTCMILQLCDPLVEGVSSGVLTLGLERQELKAHFYMPPSDCEPQAAI